MKKQFYIIPAVLAALFFCACSTTGPATTSIPPSVEKYLDNNGTDFIHYELSDLENEEDYNFHERTYLVYEDTEILWNDYLISNPGAAFNSPIIDFGIVYNPADSLIYSADNIMVPSFQEGQYYILNLRFMGFYNFPIAFKVNKIDTENKMIEFIYLKENICNGFQKIYFKPDYDSKGLPVTRIYHISTFKSDPVIIDKLIYPSFHQQTIDDFHENVLNSYGLKWDNP